MGISRSHQGWWAPQLSSAPNMVTTMTDLIAIVRLRVLLIASGTVLAVQALAGMIVLAQTSGAGVAPLGVVAFNQNTLLRVDIRVGVVVLLALLGATFLAFATPPLFVPYARKLAINRHAARWIIFSLTSSITVFLTAQLNGITAIGTLVLLYAATSTMTLFSVLQERMPVAAPASEDSLPVRAPHGVPPSMLPLSFGAAIGIVPWGIIAFHEIAASITGAGPSVAVRVITLLNLVAAFAFAVIQWREQRRSFGGTSALSDDARPQGDPDIHGERTFIILSTASVSVFAWAVLLLAECA